MLWIKYLNGNPVSTNCYDITKKNQVKSLFYSNK